MTDTILPPMTEAKVTSDYHIALAYKYVGADAIMELLEGLKKEYPKLPGVALCCASVRAEVSEALARLNAKNILTASKHGFDPETQTLSMESRKDGVYLVATAADDE